MAPSILVSFTFCLFFIPLLASSKNPTNETDRLALLQFRAGITDDPLGAMNSWNNSLHFCNWNGVTCGSRHSRVTTIDLQSLKLAGSISPYIGNLSFLKELILQENSFSKQLPTELGHLRRLETLDLRNNSLLGEIPANLSRCRNLVFIGLDYNELEGTIPADLGSLAKLEVLSAGENSLVGDIPSSFGNLSSLVKLRLTMNQLRGSIPTTLGQLQNLTLFAVGGNGFSGNIPTSMFNISSMEMFDVGLNQLRGTLPSDLGIIWPHLLIISIAGNNFTGSIPSSISNASNLVSISLASNGLAGKVPSLEKLHNLQRVYIANNSLGLGRGEANDLSFISSMTNATSLMTLDLGSNKFGGQLPESISNLSSTLSILILQGNQIEGTIPAGITNLVNLETLGLTRNLLSGGIPKDIGNMLNLRVLFLGENDLTGSIPSSIGNMGNLFRLYLTSNRLAGTIPPELGNCTNLVELGIAQNSISGTIPLQIFNITSLAVSLDLFQNRLTGILPHEVGNLKFLVEMDISGNKLSGEIPNNLGKCGALEEFYMMENSFHGTIPLSLSSLKSIRFLDLSRNNLSGALPAFLQDLVLLEYLNISFNSFNGMVPTKGVFTNISAISIEGNDELCGGIPELHLPSCKLNEPAKHRRYRVILAIVLSSLGAALVIGSSLFFWLRKRKNNVVLLSSENSLLQVSYRTLFKSTDGFSQSNLIGMGSFGSVYKGTLDDERVVAIKVFNLERRGAFKSFIAECEAMKNIRHRNLVKVITACSSIDAEGNDFKALVYEFMINGSLEEWLHPIPEAVDVIKKLTFIQRLDIAIDVGAAIDYLHHQYGQTPIVHCDLKPSNVLLDDFMTAQVGDFGLVKFLGEESNNMPVDQMSSLGVRGTVGYAAPEYGMGSNVSTQGDVYSYGILILEMFTGKRPTDDMFNDNLNLHKYVKLALADHVADIAEPMFFENTEDDESRSSHERIQSAMESLVWIFEVGLACSKEVAGERMDISDATSKLTSIRVNLTGDSEHGGRGHGTESTRVGLQTVAVRSTTRLPDL